MRIALSSLIAMFAMAPTLPAQTKQIETEAGVYDATSVMPRPSWNPFS
ncbi:hypothetical protein [Bremerella cremea]|nr:hypothetical protein [Bremerella cremea]